MNVDQKAIMKKLRDEIAKSLISSLAHLKTLGFSRQGRSWKRTHGQSDGNAIDIVEFELTVLKSSVRLRMYEMRWVKTGLKTEFGTQDGRLEGTPDRLEWKLSATTDLPDILSAVTNRLERVTLPLFASAGSPSKIAEVYSLDEFCGLNSVAPDC